MKKYYFLRNPKTNEVEILEESDFVLRFGGKFDHIVDNFCVNTYIEKGFEIPYEKKEILFFMAFIENWNKNKGNWSNLEAVSFHGLSKEEQKKISDTINNLEAQQKSNDTFNSLEEQERNQNSKSVGNGEGSLYYSKTLKRWIFQYYDTSGKRQTMRQKNKETVKDFKARVTEVKSKINNGTYIERQNDTVKFIIENHIKQKLNDGIVKSSTYARDKDTVKCIERCCSNFIYKPIQKVVLSDIQEAKEIMKVRYSQSVIDMMWQLLKKAFSIASSPSVKLIPFNIMNDENLLKPISELGTKKIPPLTAQEREMLENVLNNEERKHPYRNIVMLEWLTAMRIGEVLARSKADILENSLELHIHNTLTRDGNRKIVLGKHTKTFNKKTGIDEGERFFPISNEIQEIINEQLSGKMANIHQLLFWDYENNTFITPSEVNSWLRRLNEKYHISNQSLHNHRLRHDRITQWKEAGMDMEAIQYLAGHVEGSSITKDVYIEVSKEFAFKELKKAN